MAASAAKPPKAPAGLPATSWLLIDERSGDVLAKRDSASHLPIASATKLMTAYLALRDLRPSDEATTAPYDAEPGESLMGLAPGHTVSVRDLLYGLLMASGNDAAATLAFRISGSAPDFVDRMNATARRLGLDDTTYTDPIGLAAGNVSSARDLVDLATRLRRDARFRRIVDTERALLDTGLKERRVVNRNTLLLEEPFVDGIKTGTTLEAGYVLVASGARRGVGLVSALLGAPGEIERDAASLELLEYGFSLYERRTLVAEGERIAALPPSDGRPRVPLVAAAPLRAVARADQRVEVSFSAAESPAGDIERGQALGAGVVTLDGREVGEVPVVAARAAAAPPGDEEIGLPAGALAALAGAGVLALLLVIAAIVNSRRPPR